MHASLNKFRASPWKVNMILKSIRGKPAIKISNQLKFMVSPNCEAIRKLILSAVSNASSASLDPNSLIISEASVGRGAFLKRIHFKGRGRTGKVTRPSCNIKVVLKEVNNGK